MITQFLDRIPQVDLFVRGILLRMKKSVLRFCKEVAYWMGIVTLGMITAGVIMSFSGVHVLNFAYGASGFGSSIVLFVVTLIFYVAILPAGAIATIMAYILEIVIMYPYGSMWSDSTAGGFVNVSGVQTGWRLVRDICNIFFSVILIIIALANVLKIEAYSWKKLMPTFIIVAILINFSKTIAGFFTDFATVTMATFGGGFGGSMAAGLIGAFGLPSLTDVIGVTSISDANESGFGSLVAAYLLAMMMTNMFAVIITAYTVILIFRIVMLWFLIVMSPLAYIARILPQTKEYSSKWWKMFGNYVAVGPLMVFFLWLSLTLSFGSEVGAQETGSSIGQTFGAAIGNSGVDLQAPSSGYTATSPNVMANFIVAMLMLMASLKLVAQMAPEVGKITNMAQGAVGDFGFKLMKYSPLGVGAMWGANNAGYLAKLAGTTNALKGTAFGKGLTLMGSTILEPREFAKSVMSGYKDWRKSENQKLDTKVSAQQHDMLGSGNGILSNVAGTALGLRTSPQYIFENILAPNKGGLGRTWNSFRNKEDTENELKGVKQEKERKEEEFKEKTGNGGEYDRHENIDDATRALNELRNLDRGLSDLDAQMAAAGGTFVLQHPVLKGYLEKLKADLEGKQVAAENAGAYVKAQEFGEEVSRIDGLLSGSELNRMKSERDAKRARGEDTSYEDVMIGRLESGEFNAAALQGFRIRSASQDELNKVAQARKEYLQKERDERLGKLARSANLAAETDAEKSAALTQFRDENFAASRFIGLMSSLNPTTGRTYEEDKRSLEGNLNDWKRREQQLQTKLQLMKLPEDVVHRAHIAHEVQDALKKIADQKDSNELLETMAVAIAKKDVRMQEAVIQRLTQAGDLNMLTTSFLNRYGLEGAANAKGLYAVEDLLQGEGGMSSHDVRRILNEASLVAGFTKKQQSFAMAYKLHDGHLIRHDNSKMRATIVAAEYKKNGLPVLLNAGPSQWGYSTVNKGGGLSFELDDSGVDILRSIQQSLINDRRAFSSWSSEAKRELSEPEVIKQLRARKIDEQLIKKLQEWRASTTAESSVRFA